MEFFGIAITILAAVLTYVAWNNGRWMKQAHKDTLTILVRIEEGQAEARKEMAEARKEMAEAIKYLGSLIISESEKTRQAIRD